MNSTTTNNAVDTTIPKWFALYTKPQHEKFVESALIGKGIESFTPTVLLKNVEGYIIEKRSKNTTIVISIEAIASSVRCVIDAADIESA